MVHSNFAVLLYNNIVQSRLREVITMSFRLVRTDAINVTDKSANGAEAVFLKI